MPSKDSKKTDRDQGDAVVNDKPHRRPGLDASLYSLDAYKRWILRLQRTQTPPRKYS